MSCDYVPQRRAEYVALPHIATYRISGRPLILMVYPRWNLRAILPVIYLLATHTRKHACFQSTLPTKNFVFGVWPCFCQRVGAAVLEVLCACLMSRAGLLPCGGAAQAKANTLKTYPHADHEGMYVFARFSRRVTISESLSSATANERLQSTA